MRSAIIPGKVTELLRLLRPKQWAKNGLVFAAFLFTGRVLTGEGLGPVLVAFLAMGLASGGTYALNDVRDAAKDRLHPRKKDRPVASGRVSPGVATVFGIACALAGLGLAFGLNVASGTVVAVYLAIQVAYNAGLKRVPVTDVFTVAAGFVLRAVLSATAIDARVSIWLLLCTGGLALMLGFAKRRNEFVTSGAETREALAGYTLRSLDGLVMLFSGVAATSYLLYAIDSSTARNHPALVFTAPFVVYGIARYLLLVFSRDEGGEPADLLFGDPHVIVAVVGFLATAVLAFVLPSVRFLER